MIKSITAILSLLILLLAITTCYYERDINEELEICFVKNNSIWTMNIDGSEQRQITFPPGSANDNNPSWSPDGKRILFERGPMPTKIYIINSDMINLKPLSSIRSSSATWSTDGEKIYYYEENGSIYSIVAAKPDGTIIRRYTIATYPANSLSASPDGKYIYYLKNSLSHRLNLITGEEVQFTPTALPNGSISPDGNNVAYISGPDISIYNLSKYNSYKLITSAHSPCWTPDGKKIVYVSSGNIFIINIDGSEMKPLTSSSGCSYPCVKWKPR